MYSIIRHTEDKQNEKWITYLVHVSAQAVTSAIHASHDYIRSGQRCNCEPAYPSAWLQSSSSRMHVHASISRKFWSREECRFTGPHFQRRDHGHHVRNVPADEHVLLGVKRMW